MSRSPVLAVTVVVAVIASALLTRGALLPLLAVYLIARAVRRHKHRAVRADLRLAVLRRDRWRCVYCGFQSPANQVDHVWPRHYGGLTAMTNL